MAAHAQDQGSVVCQNILRGIVGEEPKQYTPRELTFFKKKNLD